MADRPASEIARETLKQLAARRLPPTPEHYRALYEEISGGRTPAPFPEANLRGIVRVLPAQTPAQKRLLDQFERAVAHKDWALLQSVMVGYAGLGLPPTATAAAAGGAQAATPGMATLPKELAQMLARLVETTLPALGEEDLRIHDMAQQLVAFLREPDPPLSTVQLMLGNFSYRLSFATEEQAAIRARLLELLHMVFENIAVLSADDRWLQGQAEALKAAATPPITLRRLDSVQSRLKDVIIKQGGSARAQPGGAGADEGLAGQLHRAPGQDDRGQRHLPRDHGTLRDADRPGGDARRDRAGAAGGHAGDPQHGAGQPPDARRTARVAHPHRAAPGRNPAPARGARASQRPGAPRSAHRRAQPQGPRRSHGARNRARAASARRCVWRCWTSTISRSSTTAWAM